MIRRKLYILIAIILATLAGTYIFAFIVQNRISKQITEKTTRAIYETIGTGTVNKIDYTLEVLSEDISGNSTKSRTSIIKNHFEPLKQFKYDRYTRCVTDSDGVPVYLFSSESPDISTDQENSAYRDFMTRFMNMKKTGGGFTLYSRQSLTLPERLIYVSRIKGTDLWHGIDIDISPYNSAIESVFAPLVEMNTTHRWLMHFITGAVFLFILLISMHITKQITVLEKERNEQRRKLKETNALLEIEVNIRKQIEVELKETNRELKLISSRDGLTGLANRRYYDEYIATEWERMARESKHLSLLMCDIDYFKKYNDAYGHLEGDACLRSIADVISSSCKRPADLAARYGGEEFIVVLPDTDRDGAKLVAETIRDGIEKLCIEHYDSPAAHVTISIGTATAIPRHGETPLSMVKMADTALYRAKEQGRNKIESA